MAFWSEQILEPKRAFRFIVKLKGMPNEATFYAKKAQKPSLKISEQEHKYLNHNFYFPGRATWEPISITLVDPATPDAIGNLMAIIESSGYIIPGNQNVLRTISKDRAVRAAGAPPGTAIGGDIEIIQLDADGSTDEANVLEKWTLRNAWIMEVTPSELSYDSEELSTIELKIRFDWAELRTKETLTGVPIVT